MKLFCLAHGDDRPSLSRSRRACWSGLAPQTKFGLSNSGRAGLHAKPLENAIDVVADRPRAAVNDLRDFRISFALCDPGKNLALAGSESDRCKPGWVGRRIRRLLKC